MADRSVSVPDPAFEQLLRERLHRLADHAPATVRSIDEVAVVHASRRPARRQRRFVGIGATIGTLAAGLGLTTLALNGAGDAGAASPEQAVTRFVEALEAEDVLGMIDILDPDEVPVARAAVETGRDQAERVGLVSTGLSLDGVAGVDVDLADLALTTSEVVPGVAVVRATGGTASLTFDPARFPFGDELVDRVGGGTASSVASAELGTSSTPVQLVTVERGGRWFVSVSYTVAEYLRVLDDRGPVADVEPLSSVGSSSPDDAASAWYRHLADFDLSGAASLAAPGSGDALLRYAQLWLPSTVDELANARASGWRISVDELSFATEGDGAVRTLTPSSFVLTGTTAPSLTSPQVIDPTLPTLIYTADGRVAVVPAGEPVPATIDGLDLVDIDASLPAVSNSTSSDPDGNVYPALLPSEVPSSPRSFRVELRDGCTTWSGDAADDLFGTSASPAFQVQPDGSYRSCERTQGFLGFFGLFGLGQGGVSLPSVTVERVDGQWYVSPLGTVADLVLDVLRQVPDGVSLFDTSLGVYVYGVDRTILESALRAMPVDQLPDACRALVTTTAAPDGGSDVVDALVDPIDADQGTACWDAFTGPSVTDPAVDGGDPSAVPASVAP